MFQQARYFLTTAVILTLHPAATVATAYISLSLRLNYSGGIKNLNLNNNYSNYLRHELFRRSYLRSSTIIIALSTLSDSSSSINSGPSAVRAKKPPAYQSSTDDFQQLQLLSFYHFVPISQPETIRDILFEKLEAINGLRGTVYVANEGINAQFAVPIGDPLDMLLEIFGESGCLPFNVFQSNPPNLGDLVGSDTPTFDKLIVRTRDYILRDGMKLNIGEGIEQSTATLDWSDTGIELNPSEWNEQLRQQPNIQLLDCRNDYESELGSFVSARPLNTKTFSDTWSILDSQIQSQSIDPTEPVYIFCTGGIRCVKVGAYLRQRLGVKDVRSLRHGIIGYERWNNNADYGQKGKDSLWVGENFLFDKRRFAKDDDESDAATEAN
jgi:predicted sulfurtransferase